MIHWACSYFHNETFAWGGLLTTSKKLSIVHIQILAIKTEGYLDCIVILQHMRAEKKKKKK